MTRDRYVFLGLVLLFAAVNGVLLANGVLAADWEETVMVAAGLTLACKLSHKDNPLFKVAENIFVGVATAYIFNEVVSDDLWRVFVRASALGGE